MYYVYAQHKSTELRRGITAVSKPSRIKRLPSKEFQKNSKELTISGKEASYGTGPPAVTMSYRQKEKNY